MSTVKISGRTGIIFILLAVVFWGCGKGSLSKKEKQNLARYYTEYLLTLDTTTLQGNTLDVQKQIQTRLLPKYGLTTAGYNELIQTMKENPGEWESFYEELTGEIKTRRDTLKRNTFF